MQELQPFKESFVTENVCVHYSPSKLSKVNSLKDGQDLCGNLSSIEWSNFQPLKTSTGASRGQL